MITINNKLFNYFQFTNENIVDNLSGRSANYDKIEYSLKNLWTNKNIGTTGNILKDEIPGHDVLMLRLDKK